MSRAGDPYQQLADLLREVGAKFTFSIWCRSGFLGAECQCWRCRGAPPAEHDADSEEAARRRAYAVDRARGRWVIGVLWQCAGCGRAHTVIGGRCPDCGAAQPYLELGGEA